VARRRELPAQPDADRLCRLCRAIAGAMHTPLTCGHSPLRGVPPALRALRHVCLETRDDDGRLVAPDPGELSDAERARLVAARSFAHELSDASEPPSQAEFDELAALIPERFRDDVLDAAEGTLQMLEQFRTDYTIPKIQMQPYRAANGTLRRGGR
jgi:hypothetical protein